MFLNNLEEKKPFKLPSNITKKTRVTLKFTFSLPCQTSLSRKASALAEKSSLIVISSGFTNHKSATLFGNSEKLSYYQSLQLFLFSVSIIGDSAAHGLTDAFGSHKVLNSLSFVSSKAYEAFPEIPVFPAFGNNDLPGHYILPNNSDWYKTVLTYWAPLILCEKCPDHVQKPTTMEALAKTFIDGGYYSVNIAGRTMGRQETMHLIFSCGRTIIVETKLT